MLQVFYLDVAYIALVVYECCKCIFQMFQLFQTYVASVLSSCCSVHTHMLQSYVVNVSSVLDVCCNKCFMLQIFHEQTWQGGVGEDGPLRRSGPRMRVRSEAGAAAGIVQKVVSMGVAAGTEHEVASMGG
jgi:hypothetical protein